MLIVGLKPARVKIRFRWIGGSAQLVDVVVSVPGRFGDTEPWAATEYQADRLVKEDAVTC